MSVASSRSFHRLFVTLVADGRERLRRQAGPEYYNLLTAEAHAGWEEYLVHRLSSANFQAVDRQLQVFRSVRAAFPRTSEAPSTDGDPILCEFLGSNPAERLRKIFAEYPSLEEICETLVCNWVGTVREFLGRLDRDRDKLPNHFVGMPSDTPVQAVQAGLSDPHLGGRSVARVHFGGGASVIYKPRTVAPEVHFATLLGYLNTRDITHRLRAAYCWDRGAYGWMEDVKEQPCNSAAKVEAFYWRMGALLGAIYLANGVDIHRENLVAAEECPVLIDLETLWHPQGATGVGKSHFRSVLNTGFLPWDNQAAGRAYTSSALCRRKDYKDIFSNDDDDGLGSTHQYRTHPHHLPVHDGKIQPASAFIPYIQDGFRWTGRQLLADTTGGAYFERWLRTLLKCPRRLILRSSNQYHALIGSMTSPRLLRQGRHLDESAPLFARDIDPPLNPVEIQALRQMDIPYLRQAMSADSDRPWLNSVDDEQFSAQASRISEALTESTD